MILAILLLLTNLTIIISASFHYSPQEGLEVFYYSKAAACPRELLELWYCGKTCRYHSQIRNQKVISNEEFQTQAYTAYNPEKNHIIIAFRSTENAKNWDSNFQYNLVNYEPCSGCKVHTGYYNIFKAMKDEIMQNFLELQEKQPTADVVLTGHSMGGALATLLAAHLKQNNYSVDIFYSFGSPRVGNPAFADHTSKLLPNYHRVVNHEDMIPHIPPEDLSYQHVGERVQYAEDGISFIDCKHNDCPDTMGTNMEDHIKYQNIPVRCEAPKLSDPDYDDFIKNKPDTVPQDPQDPQDPSEPDDSVGDGEVNQIKDQFKKKQEEDEDEEKDRIIDNSKLIDQIDDINSQTRILQFCLVYFICIFIGIISII